ncbi:MAG: TolC family outer membrane protein [Alphaproteobacteria bacterium]|nr:TolC family outer membrane protein [Alphaproteobacteria bacterium]
MPIAWPNRQSPISYGGIIALAVVLAPAMTLSADTLEDSVVKALTFNPEVGVVQSDRRAIDQELRQARALYLPSIDLRAAIGPEYTNSTGTRGRDTRPPGGDASAFLTRMESQLTLTQMLFDGFATDSEVAKQLARTNSAAYRVTEAAEFIALDAIEAHLDVLRNQELVRQAEQNQTAHQSILNRIREDSELNQFKLSEVHLSEARHAAASEVLETARGNLRDAKARYVKVTGIEPKELENRPVPKQSLPPGTEAAARRAGEYSPTIMIATADIDAAMADLKGSRAGYYPRFDLEVGAAANRQIDGFTGSNVDGQALLVMRYNLFRGGGDIAREREAFSRLGESRETLRRARNEAEEQARLSYNALRTAEARVLALSRQTNANAATRRGFAEEFDAGERNLLDRLDVENEYYLSKAGLTTAEFTRDFAIYRVLAVTGDLLPTLDIDHPKESINIWRGRMIEE